MRSLPAEQTVTNVRPPIAARLRSPRGRSSSLNKPLLFSGNSNPDLAREIAQRMDTRVGSALVDKFKNEECRIEIRENVRGAEVFVVQSLCKATNGNSVNDSLMELLVMIDALSRASAHRITAVVPYYGYAKQDKKSNAYEISALYTELRLRDVPRKLVQPGRQTERFRRLIAGATRLDPAAGKNRRFRARHTACFFRRRKAWQAGLLQARCREPTRLSGRNQRRQMQQGRFRATGMMNHHPYTLRNSSVAILVTGKVGHFWIAYPGSVW